MNQNHNPNNGRFATGFWSRQWAKVVYAFNVFWFAVKWRVLPLAIVAVCTFAYSSGIFKNEEVYAASTRVVEQKSELVGLSVEQLEDKLDAIVWGGESGKHTMKEGETYTTFDPPQSWIDNGTVAAKCYKRGGKVNPECFSNGPRQTKIPTIQGDWSKFHNGEKITEKDARDCAEDNHCSKRYFLDRSEYIKGGVGAWSAAHVDGDWRQPIKVEVQILIDFIREVKGIKI